MLECISTPVRQVAACLPQPDLKTFVGLSTQQVANLSDDEVVFRPVLPADGADPAVFVRADEVIE